MREREDANRTREITPLCGKPKAGNKMDALAGAQAGNRDEVEGVVANTLAIIRNGASPLAKTFGVGFIDWLDGGLEKISSPSESYEDAKWDLELRGSFIHDRACVARKG